MRNSRKLLQFCMSCGGNAFLEGLFVVDESGWETIQNIIRDGMEINYGEALGKYSEINQVLTEGDIKVLSVDQEFIDDFQTYVGKSFGHNPLEYYQEEDSDNA